MGWKTLSYKHESAFDKKNVTWIRMKQTLPWLLREGSAVNVTCERDIIRE